MERVVGNLGSHDGYVLLAKYHAQIRAARANEAARGTMVSFRPCWWLAFDRVGRGCPPNHREAC